MTEANERHGELAARLKARAVLADIESEAGRGAERCDVEHLLRTAGFTYTERGTVRIYQHPGGTPVTIHMDSPSIPVGVARRIATQVLRLVPEIGEG